MVAFLSVSVLLFAADPPKANETKPVGEVFKINPWVLNSTTFEGTVVDESGRPVSAAMVFSDYFTESTAKTDSSGAFKIVIPKPWGGLSRLAASSDDGARMSDPIEGKNYIGKKVVFTLKAAKAIRVIVRDQLGKPVANARVHATVFPTPPSRQVSADGTGTIWIPATAMVSSLVAFKEGIGLDYKNFQTRPVVTSNPNVLKQPGAEPIILTLDGAREATLRFHDPNGKPVSGVSVRIRGLTKKGRGQDYLNLYPVEGSRKTTDAGGVVRFTTVPANLENDIHFEVESETHFPPTNLTFAPNGPNIVDVLMEPKIELSGIVVGLDGKPAADSLVLFDGVAGNREIRPVSKLERSDVAGRFRFLAPVNHYYMFLAAKGATASEGLCKVVGREPIRDLKLTLKPATRVYGRLKKGDGEETARRTVLFLLYGTDYRRLPDEQKLFGDKYLGIAPSFRFTNDVGTDGSYEAWLGPGEYTLVPSRSMTEPSKLVVKDEKEIACDFEPLAPPERLRLNGRVVMSENPSVGVPNATVRGHLYNDNRRNRNASIGGTPVTDKEGAFFVSRDPGDGTVEARSQDGKLAGVVDLGERQTSVMIKIGPTATIKGRLLDDKKNPVAKREVTYHWQNPKRPLAMFTTSGKTLTNDKGEFELSGVIPERMYHLGVATRWGERGEATQWTNIVEVMPVLPGIYEAGDLPMPIAR